MHSAKNKKVSEFSVKKTQTISKVNNKNLSLNHINYRNSVVKVYETKMISKIDVTEIIGWQIM